MKTFVFLNGNRPEIMAWEREIEKGTQTHTINNIAFGFFHWLKGKKKKKMNNMDRMKVRVCAIHTDKCLAFVWILSRNWNKNRQQKIKNKKEEYNHFKSISDWCYEFPFLFLSNEWNFMPKTPKYFELVCACMFINLVVERVRNDFRVWNFRRTQDKFQLFWNPLVIAIDQYWKKRTKL